MKKIKFFSIVSGILIAFGNWCAQGIKIEKPKETEIKNIVKKFKGYVSWNKLTYELINNNLNNIYIVYDDDNNALAYSRISVEISGVVHINDLVTLPQSRGRGYAKYLIKKIKLDYPNCSIKLFPTKSSINFYTHIGFEYLPVLNICVYRPETHA